jgi:hypothetical protein
MLLLEFAKTVYIMKHSDKIEGKKMMLLLELVALF